MMVHNLWKVVGAGITLLLLAACGTVASIVYPLNEQADRARAGAYELDPDHASVIFSVSHFGFSNFKGRFDGISGALDLNPDAPENSTVTIDIDMTSLHTGVEKLDEELSKPSMFDLATHHQATFTSSSVTRLSENEATIEGVLTIKDVSGPVSLQARFIGSGTNPLTGRQTIGFSATGTIKRSDFGLTEWLPFVGDDVSLQIDVEFNRRR